MKKKNVYQLENMLQLICTFSILLKAVTMNQFFNRSEYKVNEIERHRFRKVIYSGEFD